MLNPTDGPLCVIQASVTHPDRRTEQTALSMPSSPFGTPAWQLPVITGYLHGRFMQMQPPTLDGLSAALRQRATAPIPSPCALYPHTPWHDPRVTCLLDLSITAGTGLHLGVSLVVMEQEGTGACRWMRTERVTGLNGLLAHTVTEAEAERARLRDRRRTSTDPAVDALTALSDQVAAWARDVRRQARGKWQELRAEQARGRLRASAAAGSSVLR
ncbi:MULTISPECIES: hypothetical protein [unclassified Streptomyces]|uniref:hypothetical protein n=1 Tax=unclassified Streptomyces TaxID=2593676 RepID=UPI000DB9F1D6|nr:MULTISPECIES: hypothetical protein [unclassified Streptomyces]MYT68372.1 hypothetical protein [Streptomyces sp. SID8367]RAJ77009.1 hypothetical protein K377_06178 [Streptomyces sp. PsTaAH-137]